VVIDCVPTGVGNDYFFTVQCREDHSNGVQYEITMANAQAGENAIQFKQRMEAQLGVPVRVTSNPYHSIVQSSYSYWYVYKLQ
jgi:hypothetical protein